MATSSVIVGIRVRPFNSREQKYNSKCIIAMDKGGTTHVSVCKNGKMLKGETPREFNFDHAFWTHDQEDGTSCILVRKQQQQQEDQSPSFGEGGNAAVGNLSLKLNLSGLSKPSSQQQQQAAPLQEDGGTLPVFADQQHVYDRLGKHVLNNVFEGYNACLFAYGQTGSGKTYSMMGTPSDPGVLPRIGRDIFDTALDRFQTEKETMTHVDCAFCEIYNDDVRDLQAQPVQGKLPILPLREHPKLGVFVQDITKKVIKTPEELEHLLEHGLGMRATAATGMNHTSSRSHAVIMLNVTQTDKNGAHRCGKLCLVDLAGSERVGSTGATGLTATEGQAINLSLSTLRTCLERLADLSEKGPGAKNLLAPPYRDASLTFLLRDNLGGNSKTSMLAAVSPADLNYEETMSTLRFASVTKKVRTQAVVNESPQAKLIRELREEREELLKRLSELRHTSSGGLSAEQEVSSTSLAAAAGATDDDGAATSPRSRAEERELLSAIDMEDLLLRQVTTCVVDDDDEDQQQQQSEEGREGGREHDDALGVTVRKTGVFSSWTAPQLVNLNPDCTNAGFLVVPLAEGTNMISVEDTSIRFDFDGLKNQVSVFGEGVFQNGVLTDGPDHGSLLRHNDRIVVGNNAFRFTFACSVCDFSNDPADEDHLRMLERYGRMQIWEERGLDAINIGRAFFTTRPAPTAAPTTAPAADASPQPNNTQAVAAVAASAVFSGSPMGSSSLVLMTPRLLHPVLAAMSDDVSWSRNVVFTLESDLARVYPAEADADGNSTAGNAKNNNAGDGVEYNRAIQERETFLEEKEKQIEELRQRLHHEEVLDEEANEEDEAIQHALTERIFSAEMQWHATARQLRHFRVDGPSPAATTDAAMWQALAYNPPFLSDPNLQIERCATVKVAEPKQDADNWMPRYVASSKTFIYIFMKGDGRERVVSALYLPGASVSMTAAAAGDDKWQLHVRPSCPRHASDGSCDAVDASLFLRFAERSTAHMWAWWIETCATPEMPHSMLKRWVKDHAGMEFVDELDIDGEVTVPMELAANKSNSSAKKKDHWRHDSEVTHCTLCRSEFSLFRRRHHCRGCGDIFCFKCWTKKYKRCEACNATHSYVTPGAATDNFVEILKRRRKCIALDDTELESSQCLKQRFLVDIVQCVPRLPPPPSSNISSVSVFQDNEDGDYELYPSDFVETGVAFAVDMYRDRVHRWHVNDIQGVSRCMGDHRMLRLLIGTTVQASASQPLLHDSFASMAMCSRGQHEQQPSDTTSGGTTKLPQRRAYHPKITTRANGSLLNTYVYHIYFDTAMECESAMQALLSMMKQRVFLPGLSGLVESTDVAISAENDDEVTALVRATNSAHYPCKLWVGQEDGRPLPLHKHYGLFVYIGSPESCPTELLHRFNVAVIAQVPIPDGMNTGESLYVFCREEWERCVTNVRVMSPSEAAELAPRQLNKEKKNKSDKKKKKGQADAAAAAAAGSSSPKKKGFFSSFPFASSLASGPANTATSRPDDDDDDPLYAISLQILETSLLVTCYGASPDLRRRASDGFFDVAEMTSPSRHLVGLVRPKATKSSTETTTQGNNNNKQGERGNVGFTNGSAGANDDDDDDDDIPFGKIAPYGSIDPLIQFDYVVALRAHPLKDFEYLSPFAQCMSQYGQSLVVAKTSKTASLLIAPLTNYQLSGCGCKPPLDGFPMISVVHAKHTPSGSPADSTSRCVSLNATQRQTTAAGTAAATTVSSEHAPRVSLFRMDDAELNADELKRLGSTGKHAASAGVTRSPGSRSLSPANSSLADGEGAPAFELDAAASPDEASRRRGRLSTSSEENAASTAAQQRHVDPSATETAADGSPTTALANSVTFFDVVASCELWSNCMFERPVKRDTQGIHESPFAASPTPAPDAKTEAEQGAEGEVETGGTECPRVVIACPGRKERAGGKSSSENDALNATTTSVTSGGTGVSTQPPSPSGSPPPQANDDSDNNNNNNDKPLETPDMTCVILASNLPEFYGAKCLFLHISEFGTAAIPISQIESNGVVELLGIEVFRDCQPVAYVDVTLRCEWVVPTVPEH